MILFAVTITAGCYVLLERGYGHEKVFLLYDAVIGIFCHFGIYLLPTRNKKQTNKHRKKGQEQTLGFAINV